MERQGGLTIARPTFCEIVGAMGQEKRKIEFKDFFCT